jgi:tetratricopeptide (TPR) repeat protein
MLKALAWLKERGDARGGMRLACGLGWFWQSSAYNHEALEWLPAFLGMTEGLEMPAQRARALYYLSRSQFDYGLPIAQIRMLEESVRLCRQVGDSRWIAIVLAYLGFYRALGEQKEAARSNWEESLRIARETGDPWVIAYCLYWAYASRPREDLDKDFLRKAEEEVISLSRQAGEPYQCALSIHGMGDMLMYQKDYTAAIPWYVESLPMAREIGQITLMLNTLGELVYCHAGIGQLERARELCKEGFDLALSQGYKGFLANFVGNFGFLAGKTGNPRRAVRLFGAEQALRLSLSDPKAAAKVEPFPYLEKDLGLDKATVAEEWAKGRAMSWDQAVAYALQDPEMEL